MDANGAVIKLEDLVVDFNWSAKKARITSPLSVDSILVLPQGHWGRVGKRLAVMQVKAHEVASAPVSRKAAALKPEPAQSPACKVAKTERETPPPKPGSAKRCLAPEAAFAPPPPVGATKKTRISGKTTVLNLAFSARGQGGAAAQAADAKAEDEDFSDEDAMAQPVT